MKATTKSIQNELGEVRATIINSIGKNLTKIERATFHEKKMYILTDKFYGKLHPINYLLVSTRVENLQNLKSDQFPENSHAHQILKKYGK